MSQGFGAGYGSRGKSGQSVEIGAGMDEILEGRATALRR